MLRRAWYKLQGKDLLYTPTFLMVSWNQDKWVKDLATYLEGHTSGTTWDITHRTIRMYNSRWLDLNKMPVLPIGCRVYLKDDYVYIRFTREAMGVLMRACKKDYTIYSRSVGDFSNIPEQYAFRLWLATEDGTIKFQVDRSKHNASIIKAKRNIKASNRYLCTITNEQYWRVTGDSNGSLKVKVKAGDMTIRGCSGDIFAIQVHYENVLSKYHKYTK